MKKIPFYVGLGMIGLQALLAGIYFLSQVTISQASLDMWIALIVMVPTNLTAFMLMIYGLVAEE